MDFIEFLRSGGENAVRRVRFDGRTFELENASGSDASFELSGDSVKDKGGSYTGYTLSKYHNTIINGNPYFTVYKGGAITDYKIELDRGYAVLKYLDSTVSSDDRARNYDNQNYGAPARENSGDESSLLIKIVINLVLGLLISYVPPLIFRKFILNAKRGEKYGNGLYFFAVIIGLIVFGGGIITPMIAKNLSGASLSFMGQGGTVGLNGIFYCYLVCHILSLLMFFFAKPISAIFKSERAINITFAIYLVIFIALEATFIGMYMNSVLNISKQLV